MLVMLAASMIVTIIQMAMQVVFYAVSAYWIAKMAHKGWEAGK